MSLVADLPDRHHRCRSIALRRGSIRSAFGVGGKYDDGKIDGLVKAVFLDAGRRSGGPPLPSLEATMAVA